MAQSFTPELVALVRACAENEGFALTGIGPALEAGDPAATASANRFAGWLDAGRAGEMQYLRRRSDSGALLRSSARTAMPWARSVIVCAFHYNLAGPNPERSPAPRSIDPAPRDAGWIARYAWTGGPNGEPLDYHDDLLRRLRAVEAALQEQAPCQSRCYVDTGPLLERDFAARAGVGWIGKNTCVINQQAGSWLLLAVIVTSLDVEGLTPQLAPDRCGSCTRCIDACPTDALILPLTGTREMDASRCIAYLTIEKKGDIPHNLREPMGRQVFGCDICQEVCPWNRHAPVAEPADVRRRDELINPSLEALAALDQAAFRQMFAGSPLERTKLKRLQRNVAIAMANSGDATHLPQLEQWAAQAEGPLREAAQWAIDALRSASIKIDSNA